jgi:hypothetical protein
MKKIKLVLVVLFFILFISNSGICETNATNSTGNQELRTPRIPQFPTVTHTDIWTDDNSLRLGYYNVNIQNIQPIVYYYECPEGDIVKSSDPNACNAAMDHFGGVDDTIKGDHCFTHRCDETAIAEDQETVLSGCQYVNDGEWQ